MNYPRVTISGLSGDSGKTAVACGLLASLRERGMNVSGFKKGPDYIDAAWLSLSAAKPARNLDTYMMGFARAKESFLRHACPDGINIIEGNRGLFDGVDEKGTHSTAELAKLLQSPVIIVHNVSKMTRTSAASILGCIKLDPALNIAGVILNHVAGERHYVVARKAIEETTGVRVLGGIPRLSGDMVIPSRHLGLSTPGELHGRSDLLHRLKTILDNSVDMAAVLDVCRSAPPLEVPAFPDQEPARESATGAVTIGFLRDGSFSFYYPENLEALAREGANLIPISPSKSAGLGSLDALYIGGGFPEIHADELASNKRLMEAIVRSVENGLPVYAECGGLMYLAKDVVWHEKRCPLCGVLPIVVQVCDKPQGHGYSSMTVDTANPFFETGTVLKGHEFHYSKIVERDAGLKTSLAVTRGTGCFDGRDGLTYKNVFASYIHLHASAAPEWVTGMMQCARAYKLSDK